MRLVLACVALVTVGGAVAAQVAAPPRDPERYLARLALAGPGGPADAARLVAQAWPALPDSVRRALGGRPDRLTPDAGYGLVVWWHAQDPLPATPENEAVLEHLRRVSEAERRFPDSGPTGFDERGDVLVKLGEPTRAQNLRSRTLDLSPRVLRIPNNEMWTYGTGGPVYLFYDRGRGRGWRQGGAMDLLPRDFQAPVSGLRVVKPLYDFVLQIAPYDPSYDQVLSSLGDLREGVVPMSYGRLPRQALLSLVRANLDHSTYRAAAYRDDVTEPTGPALPDVAEIPLAVRVARFRAASGGVRVEVAYAPEPGAFAGLRGPHVVRSAATLTEAERPAALPFPRVSTEIALPSWATRPGEATPVEVATLDGLGRDQRVAVQLDVVGAGGAVVGRVVRRVGRLAPLVPSPGGLVVSDPLPHLVPPRAARAVGAASGTEAARDRRRLRYPYAVVVPGATVGVYVEAYDLAVDGGRSRYEVERAVHVVRGGRRELVSQSATVSGTTSPTAREFIVLPTPGDVLPGDTVELSGTIRDLVSGRSGTWTLSFGVAE